jgi:acylphosphatase
MVKSYSIRVFGKVQGVFFRASTEKKAKALGVNGIVRNERDGSVFIEAEAEEDVIEQFIHWCKRGPEHARVDSIDIAEIDYKGYLKFEVTR